MITVLNYKTATPEQRQAGVYIGRAHRRFGLQHSPLANPYRITQTQPRSTVIEQYKEYLGRALWYRGQEHDELERLVARAKAGDLLLLCWCAPEACHGDVIKALIEVRLKEDKAMNLHIFIRRDSGCGDICIAADAQDAAKVLEETTGEECDPAEFEQHPDDEPFEIVDIDEPGSPVISYIPAELVAEEGRGYMGGWA